jgi:hypothetical protein
VNGQEIYDAVTEEVGDDLADALIWRAINRSLRKITGAAPWPFREAIVGSITIPTSGVVTLPSNYGKVQQLSIPGQTSPLEYNRADDFVGEHLTELTETAENPTDYYIVNGALHVWPLPAAEITDAKLFYLKKQATITSATSESSILLPEEYHEWIVMGALVYLNVFDDEFAKANLYKAMLRDEMAEAIEELTAQQYDATETVQFDFSSDIDWELEG